MACVHGAKESAIAISGTPLERWVAIAEVPVRRCGRMHNIP